MSRYIYTTNYIKRIDNSKSKMKRKQKQKFAKLKKRSINHFSSDFFN